MKQVIALEWWLLFDLWGNFFKIRSESFSFPGGRPCKQPHLLVYGRGRGEGSPVIVTTCILFLSIFRFSSRHLVLPMNTPPTGEKPVKGVGFGVG